MSNYRTVDVGRLSNMYRALGNPNRLSLLIRLIDICSPEESCSADTCMTACVSDLAEGLGIGQSTVSHHLKELRQAGLITMTREGRNVVCRVNTDALEELNMTVADPVVT